MGLYLVESLSRKPRYDSLAMVRLNVVVPGTIAAACLAMARSRATLEEQVVNLHRRATETRQIARKKVIVLCMTNHPETIDELWEKMKSLSYDYDVITRK